MSQQTTMQVDKSKELRQTLDQLIEGYRTDPEKLAEMLAFKKQFYNYSINNTMLIYDQNQYATYVASYEDWKKKGYQVQKGQHGIKVFFPIKTEIYEAGKKDGKTQYRRVGDAPPEDQEKLKSGQIKSFMTTRFGIGNVFDISQTNCPPEDYPKIFHMGYTSDQHAALYDAFKSFVVSKGNPVIEKDLQSISLRGQYYPDTGEIQISDKLNDTERLSTLTHEYGHALMLADPKTEGKPESVQELEADCVSIMLQQEFGIDLTDSRKKHFTDHYRVCSKMEDFKLEDLLKNVNAAYMNVRKELDPFMEQVMAPDEKTQNSAINLAPEQLMEQHLKELYPTMKANAGYYILDEVPGYAVGFNPKAPEALVLWSVNDKDDYRNGIYRHTLDGFDYRDLVESGLHVERIQDILSEIGYTYEQMVVEATSETTHNAQAPLLEQLINGDALIEDYKKFDLPAESENTLSSDQLTEYQNKLGMQDDEFKAWITAGDNEKPMLLRNICFCRVNNISFPDYMAQGLSAAETPPVKPEKSESKPASKNRADFKEQDAAVLEYIKHNVPILKVAEDMGFTPQKLGTYYTLKEHDSVRFYEDTNSFHRFSTNVGGSTIDFVMHFGGMNEKEAIQSLKDKYVGDRFDALPPPPPAQPAAPKEQKPFELPEKADGKFARAYAYLTKTRCLDSDIVQSCMKDGLLYEDNKHNVVFVGKDADGNPAYATRHTTMTNSSFKRDVAGSRQNIGFMVDNKADRLYVTEAPIDALSVMCLRKKQGQAVNGASYLATCGTGKDTALYYRLDNNPNIKEVVLANDNDEAGQKANRKIHEHLRKNYPNIKVSMLTPKGKDINEHLCKFSASKCIPQNPKKPIIQEVER